MARAERRRRVATLAAVAAALFALVAIAVLFSSTPPEGPVAVDWDGTRCARCGMLVSSPAFAAQLHLEDGSVRHYDDPGCLLADLDDPATPAVHAAWLHHHRDERWISLERAAFARVAHSPMGYGLAAFARGESADAIDAEAALSLVRRFEGAPAAGAGTADRRAQP